MKTTAIQKFMENHAELNAIEPKRALYIHVDGLEIFAIEGEKYNGYNKVIVFEYDCAEFSSARTEKDTFNSYMLQAMIYPVDYLECVTF